MGARGRHLGGVRSPVNVKGSPVTSLSSPVKGIDTETGGEEKGFKSVAKVAG